MTQTGVVVGSPGYMSPEQALGREVGAASDVFSLGAVLAFAATGRGAFGDGAVSHATLLYQVVHGEPDLAGVPQSLMGLIRACLQKDPANRPAPAEIVAGLAPHGVEGVLSDWLSSALSSTIAAQRPGCWTWRRRRRRCRPPRDLPGLRSGRHRPVCLHRHTAIRRRPDTAARPPRATSARHR